MSQTPFTSVGRSDEEASLWAARLDCAVLSPSQQAELDSWLAADPGHRALLSSYCTLSARLDGAVPALEAAGAFERPAKRIATPQRWSGMRIALAGLAAAALTMGVVWYGWGSGRPEKITAAAGERRSFTLSDGSKIELNANTSLLVENGRNERRVRLDNGEAFFVVSKDKSRPFIVETPAGSVRVTGTQFNVLTETASQLDVTVVEGTVQVRPGEPKDADAPNPVILGAGDQLSVEDGGSRLRPLSSGDVDDALAWRKGQLVCVGMPLSEVLVRFGHYHGIKITASAGAASKRLGARFNLDDLNGFLLQLEHVLPVRVRHAADGSVSVSLLTEP